VFNIVHDNKAHISAKRIHYLLRPYIYIPRLRQRILEYSVNYPIYKKAELKRKLPWGSLEPIDHPMVPLSVLYLDFAEGLPLTT
jgi:hypothetical protein